MSKVAYREKEYHSALFINLGEYWNRPASYDYNGQLGDTKNWFRANLSYLGSEGSMNNTKANSGVMSFSLRPKLISNENNLNDEGSSHCLLCRIF